jgi:hypothetical protein
MTMTMAMTKNKFPTQPDTLLREFPTNDMGSDSPPALPLQLLMGTSQVSSALILRGPIRIDGEIMGLVKLVLGTVEEALMLREYVSTTAYRSSRCRHYIASMPPKGLTIALMYFLPVPTPSLRV